ncbi:hypothetical protein Ddc_05199 [Ditylenchus destructor]|nr:hypothetical protein Ddc_05199 [Ditylenchus destructor]
MKYFATLAFWITLILYIHCAYGKLVVVSISTPQAPVENDLDTSKDVATSRIERLRKNQKIFEQTMNTDGFEGIELFHKNFESISAYAIESGRVLADHINGKATAEELQEARKIMDIITRAQERSRKKYAEQERETERRERERQQSLERERVLEQNRRQEEEVNK